MDIQGAFDTVLRNRPILRLREQGWPPNLACWVGSFMQDRSARVRYQDIVTASSPLQGLTNTVATVTRLKIPLTGDRLAPLDTQRQ
ncbi:hypothetical protein HIM_11579 [Hirsutella minnesotensis 3608]|uniref:Reverse transcriptase domain-containing protein n=1 Tax=Hirsutella minnesotensis 3608 TaxID=1043627 RepID=A0A0F7ZFF2_9HYPO|nr:hypothetical protein HIM_11579 [Hirsutella minnesotensis 3608]